MIVRKMMISMITWLSLSTLVSVESSDRWSRQTSNSEWIPLARPRSALPHQTSVQEYQQQLLQLQKTQESIQKLLLLQQQLRSQQQLLQNQAYLPNVVDDNKQPFRQNAIPNRQVDFNSETSPPQLSPDALPPVYSSQQFKQSQEAAIEGGVPPSGGSGNDDKGENSDEEIQVVYVPAETLAQRGQSKEERNRDHNQFSFSRHENRYSPQTNQQQVDSPSSTGVSAEDNNYNQEYVQFPQGQEAVDQFYKEARQKELDRLNEEGKEIARQAKLQAAARQREQERARQRDMEKKIKELAKIEELAKQRELDRIREARERQRAEEEQARRKEEKARQAEIERLAALERQKNAEIERSIARQKELEKLAREDEEHREKAAALKSSEDQIHHQHHTETGKPKGTRHRSKPRTRPQKEDSQESSTIPPPNQPPLAVFMGPDLEAQESQPQFQVIDALRFLRDAKTIAVLDHVSSSNPRVFVGPANLDPPHGYSKFELPYLSSLDMNRVERRVDKLPFFVAPLSFNPPVGYYKIPFPHPHIGSVIVNSIDDNIGPSASQESSKTVPNVIDQNLPFTGPGQAYQASYDSANLAPYGYSPAQQQTVTPQYPGSYPTANEGYKYRHQYDQQSVTPYPNEYTTDYRKPNVVSSYSYNPELNPTTPAYQDGYSHTRVQPNKDQEITSQLAQINQHDYSQHRHIENPYQHPSQQASLNPHHGIYHLNPNIQNSYEEIDPRPVGPNSAGPNPPIPVPGYSLPPELPPIHPQLPGLVNSLIDAKEADKFITTPIATTTTEPPPTTTTTTTTTTTEVPTTTYRPRVRQRGRITARTTTTPLPTSLTVGSTTQRNYERTRRPFNRSRSRFTTTTTTEEYKDTYEPSRSKVTDTTTRYTQEQYRRPTTPKIQKFKTRNHEASNQISNPQTQETLADEGSIPEDLGNSRQPYQNYNLPLTGNPSTYGDEHSFTTERDYSKNPNYPQLSHDRFRGSDTGYQSNLESQGYDYDVREGANNNNNNNNNAPSTPISVTPEYYYADKTESIEGVTDTPYSQVDYRPSINYSNNNNDDNDNDNNNNSNEDDRSSTSGENSPVLNNNQYSAEIHPRPYESFSEPETTTEVPTTTEQAPVIIRQRVRARLGGRPRQDSPIQTAPRGSQDEYVHFSAVNQPAQRVSTTARTTRPTRPKTRPNYLTTAQVLSEGNDYVRIQSANRPHPKTIVQAAAPKTTTTTTTTTVAPISNDDSSDEEYGFIRKPNFNQPHNLISSKFRAPESPIQLQNIAPTDETAADSSPTHTQVPNKNRQKYQSPNRPRPTIKSSNNAPITTTPAAVDNQLYTAKPRVRAEEPKNRIRTRVRRPGRRRTTTTSTTTEGPLDENNNLPLEENYPRISINQKDSSIERQSIYDANYETLPVNTGSNGPSRSDYVYENYPSQEFMLNFGASDIVEEQQDQSNLRHQAHSDESRLRPYSHQPDSDIYGSESQWSTKLTKSSFQPANQLPEDQVLRKQKEFTEMGVENKGEAPEIITARPEDAFITVLVASDNQTNTPGLDMTSETTVPTDFGQKSSAAEEVTGTGENLAPRRRIPSRRRRIRVRVRPSPSDDFVTAESQHFNSAVNNFVHEQVKPSFNDQSSSKYRENLNNYKEPPTPEVPTESITTTGIAPTTTTTTTTTTIPDSTINTEITERTQSEVSTSLPVTNETTETIKSDGDSYNTDSGITTTDSAPATYETTIFGDSFSTESTTPPVPQHKSWDSSKAYTDWLMRKMKKPLKSEYDWTKKDGDSKEAKGKDRDDGNGNEEHPKNHRSEWSEVRYPDRSIFGYGRSDKQEETSTTQVPGVVTKTEGESNVETISDYVQAIFDTMKTADEEHAILDNAPDLWDDETKPTTQPHSHSSSTSISVSTFTPTPTPTSTETSTADKPTALVDNRGDKAGKVVERIEKRKETDAERRIQILTETETETETETKTTEESTSTINPSNDGSAPNILGTLITTTEPPTAKNASALLGAILRTSTSTKVSHMTEICYRGRCVMTKPNKDSHNR
ncbi:mucin-5AC isoform X2 [Microplitis demolitor]|uniref:mucin-5AC isoform X2 n=1 Tax=Microplitis demolitor TaxID=69319 RepID=UPI0004CC8FE0|nr:mucin-5AC isoform X2 [Microplitis demolitor]